MELVQIVFSPTGGTQKAADALTADWQSPVRKIDLTCASLGPAALQVEKDAAAVIALPSYGGRIPSLAAQRLERVRANGTPCILVCVYGNRAYEDTLVEMQDLAERCGFLPIAAVAAIAEHSIMHQYAAGRPDRQDKAQLRDFSKQIRSKLSAQVPPSPVRVPGSRPYKKAGGAGLVPKADKRCTGCGLCAANCPAQAISRSDLRSADSKKCISCMRCVTQCPRSARKVNGAMVSVAALAIKKACSQRKENELFL